MSETLNLLLVEDDPLDAELIVQQLGSSGFSVAPHRVWSESDLREALRRSWDLVLADFAMPGFDGARAFQICREADDHLPFVFVSGHENAGAREAMNACGCARVSKQQLDELAEVVRSAVQRSVSAAHAWGDAHFREHRRLSIALEVSRAGIVEHRFPLDEDTYCSERWARTLGYEPDDLAERLRDVGWLESLIHPDDSDQVQRRYEEFLNGARERCELHLRARHRGGHYVPLALYFGALARDDDRCARHVVGLMVDLSQRDALYQAWQKAAKMSAVGRLAGGIAHDFNNLLTAIIGLSTFASDDAGPLHPSYDSLQGVLEVSERARSLTSQLLAFARLRPVRPRAVRLQRLLEGASPPLQARLGPDVSLALRVPKGVWPALVDPSALQEVVSALIVNAREAMPDGGQLTLSLRNVTLRAGHQTLGADGAPLPVGDYVALDVADTGRGIRSDRQTEIFEPFFTTKSRGWATGLGLSTAYGVLAQAGGCLTVESQPGQGATFTALLPRAVDDDAEAQGGCRTRATPRPPRVLVVDDNDVVRKTVVRSLTRAGLRVSAAGGASEALTLFEQLEGDVDLLVTDVVMPDMRGDQLVDILLERRPELPVLYVSGYAESCEGGGRLPPAPDNTLYKPFTPDELSERVRSLLAERAEGRRGAGA